MPDIVGLVSSYKMQSSEMLAKLAANMIVERNNCVSPDIIKAILKSRGALDMLDTAIANHPKTLAATKTLAAVSA